VSQYVDEFGDKTNDTYVKHYSSEGSFSNSATDNSKLKVSYFFDKDIEQQKSKYFFTFNFYEYGTQNVKNWRRDRNITFNCRVKDNKNNIFKIKFLNPSDYFSIYRGKDEFYNAFLSATEESVKLKFSCSDDNESLAKYKFVLDFKDFNKVLKIAGIKLK
tara:strand:+ start:1564 stop:2043 length:480 start_codon:yes stop_codon:yes gene_type:complete